MTTRSGNALVPAAADVIRYAYLWKDKARAGQVEGEKDRPCAVVLTVLDDEARLSVYVLPITSVPPTDPADGIEVPATTRHRLGLQDKPCWVMLTECNRFVWPSSDLRPMPWRDDKPSWLYGALPGRLFDRIRKAVVTRHRQRRFSVVPRAD